MQEVIIGTQGTQTFQITDDFVSRKHAILTVKDNGDITFKDNNSTNGTFIHDGTKWGRLQPGKEYKVTADTFVRLGQYTQFHLKKVIPPEEKYDVRHLETIYDNYNNSKMDLQGKIQSVNGLRGLMVLISIGTGAAGGVLAPMLDLDMDDKVASGVVGVGLAIILVVVLLLYINSRNRKLIKAQNDNEMYFRKNYVCPKCRTPFGAQLYDNIIASERCPKCKAKFFDPRYNG